LFRVFNEYLGKINLVLDQDLIDRLMDAVNSDESTSSICINVSFNKYIVDIKLKEFSVEEADRAFRHLTEVTSYPYSHISIRYNESTRVKYRYATCKEDKSGVSMDIVYS
jgi:hypothetical protein